MTSAVYPRPANALPDTSQPSAGERLRAFCDREASPEAAELAGYLAAAPLTLPIMRLVQRAMLPRSGPEHLAEVFLSGLLTQAPGTDAVTDPDSVLYEFRDDVREQLLGGLTRRESLRVLEVLSGVSGVVAERFGGSLDFRALAPTLEERSHFLPKACLHTGRCGRLAGHGRRLRGARRDPDHRNSHRQAGQRRPQRRCPGARHALRRQGHTR